MSFLFVFIFLVVVVIGGYFIFVLSAEEREFRKQEKEVEKPETPIQKAKINIDNIDDALEKAKGNEILLEDIKKELIAHLTAANKKGQSDLVRKYNAALKKLNDYLE